MNQRENKNNIKLFLVKLLAITFAVIIVINMTYNLMFADKIEKLNMIFSLNEKEILNKLKIKLD